MVANRQQFKRHFKYFWSAKTAYQIHSPFVFEFAKEVLEDKRSYYAFEDLEDLREELTEMSDPIHKKELGAGSSVTNTLETTISEIAKFNQSKPQVGRMLFRLINWLKPKYMVELGTAFGITTMYQAMASLNGKMITIEGCDETAAMALETFEAMEAENVEIVVGNFDVVLPTILKNLPQLDYMFIDGNHRKEPTLKYFEMCLPYVHNDTILVFDDVRWSDGMFEAWQTIKKHEQVTLTLEVFDVGIVFFKKEILEKRHFELLPTSVKPWNSLFSK